MDCEVRFETKGERVLTAALMPIPDECQQILKRLSLDATDVEMLHENGMSSIWVCQDG